MDNNTYVRDVRCGSSGLSSANYIDLIIFVGLDGGK